MTWLFVLGLSAGAYVLKLLGFAVLPRLGVTKRAAPLVALLPPALLGALVVVGTFERAGGLALDERALGMLAAVVAVALRAPLLVVIVVAPVVTALARAL